MAEWWYNTTFHSTINTTPYEVVYGQAPPLHLPYLPHDSLNDVVDRSFLAREEMLRTLKTNSQKVVNQMKQQANKGRSERESQVGDWVFLKLQMYRQSSVEKRKSDKLAPRFFGPYEVMARIGQVANTLKLPEGAKIQPTFHVSLLKKCLDPSISHVHPPEDMTSSVRIREPATIVDRRMVQKRGKTVTEVLVHWKEESLEEATWEEWQEFQLKFPNFVKI